MAFGMMQQKFGILCLPIQCKLNNIHWLLLAITKLHNYCINKREGRETTIDSNSVPEYYPMHGPNDNSVDNEGFVDAALDSNGYSHLCESMVE
jgi:hypothetical protein